MGCFPTICIAGKNSIAIKGLEYCLEKYPKSKILFLPNSLDDGIDKWQKSFKRYGEKNGLQQVSISELYEIENLVFFSLEFSDLISTKKFKSQKLFNIHFSLLPSYKGMYTSAHTLLNGEVKSGVTIHRINDGIDTGDIIDQIEFKIDINDTARDLYLKYLKYSEKLFVNCADQIINNNFTSRKQSALFSSYYSTQSIDYKSLNINLKKTAFEIHNQFRAFNFREYQMPFFENWSICKTKILNQRSTEESGKILYENEEKFLISSIDYNIELIKDYYPLFWESSIRNNTQSLLKSLNYIQDIDMKNKKGWNALILACYNGSFEASKILLENGANSSTQNHKGTSALMYALDYYSKSSDSRIFKLLLENKADTAAKDYKSKGIKQYCVEKNCSELLDLLD